MDFDPAVTFGLPKAGYLVPVAAAAVGFTLLVLERVRPLRKSTRPFVRRFLTNACITAMAIVAGALIARFVSHDMTQWASVRGIGLLGMFEMPFAAQLVAGFLLMDITFYYWHRINHVVPLLWRFHNVHHADPDLDVTTSLRFHVVEVLYSAVFRALQVLIIGASPLIYFIYETVFQMATLFHHSNLKIPTGVERVLNLVVVTPRMHGIHHSDVRNETNSNYSVVFRWWDLIHMSLRIDVPQEEVRIGVAGYRAPEDNSIKNLMLMPFRRQRDYWPDAETKSRNPVLGSKKRHRQRMAE